jgi:hypothetical protein
MGKISQSELRRGKAELRKVKYLWGVRRNGMGYGMHKLSLY